MGRSRAANLCDRRLRSGWLSELMIWKTISEKSQRDHIKSFYWFFLVTVLLGYKIPELTFQTSIYDLSIENLPQNLDYLNFKKEFGSEEFIIVAVRAEDVFSPDAFLLLDRMSKKLAGIPGVKRVISLPDIKRDIDIGGKMSLEKFRALLKPVDLMVKTVVSGDARAAALTMILDDRADKDSVIQEVDYILKDEKNGQAMYQVGLPLVSKALASFTQKDFLTLPPITFAIILVVLFFFVQKRKGASLFRPRPLSWLLSGPSE